VATVRAVIEAPSLSVIGGIPAILASSAAQKRRVVAQGFPASGQMVLAVTDRRLLVFQMPVFHQRPKLQGEVPFESLRAVSLDRAGLSPKLRFVLASGAEVTFATYRLDRPEEFVRVLDRAFQTQAFTDAQDSQPPPVPAIPPPPPH